MEIDGPSALSLDSEENVANDETHLELSFEKTREAFEITVSDKHCESIHEAVEMDGE